MLAEYRRFMLLDLNEQLILIYGLMDNVAGYYK